jgi:hypothetical protein
VAAGATLSAVAGDAHASSGTAGPGRPAGAARAAGPTGAAVTGIGRADPALTA